MKMKDSPHGKNVANSAVSGAFGDAGEPATAAGARREQLVGVPKSGAEALHPQLLKARHELRDRQAERLRERIVERRSCEKEYLRRWGAANPLYLRNKRLADTLQRRLDAFGTGTLTSCQGKKREGVR